MPVMRLLAQACAAVVVLSVVVFASMLAWAYFFFDLFGPRRPYESTVFVLVVFGPASALAVAFVLYGCVRHMCAEHALRTQQDGLCHHCGYDLRASPDRCPECGAIAQRNPRAAR